jgi:site-specific DNA-methyltransferase (adenine-specific)
MVSTAYADELVTVYHGDALDVLRGLPDRSVDAVVTDPPAGIAFMGRAWDHHRGGREQWSAWLAEVMGEALRVAKPGAHALVWALPRTSHWTACGLEDAGWEIRDRVSHLFGSGFPKSLAVDKAIDKAAGAEREVVGTHASPAGNGKAGTVALGGAWQDAPSLTAPATEDARRWSGWGTALKPAAEDWWLARKPLAGTVVGNVLAYGTGALNIDACRVPHGDDVDMHAVQRQQSANDLYIGGAKPGDVIAMYKAGGRWPSNVVLSHTPDCGQGCVPGCPVTELDQQSGTSASPSSPVRQGGYHGGGFDVGRAVGQAREGFGIGYADSGGASRFFPVFRYEAKADSNERPRVNGTAHPTVKPLNLMRWLVRLVTPPGGLVLDPFAGSGTTAEACVIEGFRCTAVEREAAYLPFIVARLTKPIQPAFDVGTEVS